MTPEQIEGYLKRLSVTYTHQDEPGPNGTFKVRFETAVYRSTLPPRGKKRLQLIINLHENGQLLTVSAPYVYHAADARNRGVFCEYLIDLNFRVKVAQFQMDRRDGEVSCQVCLPVANSNVGFEDFQKLLYVIPFVVEFHHRQTRAVMKRGKLPPVPKVPQLDLMIVDVLQRAGSLANLRKIVDAHERRERDGDGSPPRTPAHETLNPLPPSRDPTKDQKRLHGDGGADVDDKAPGGHSSK